MEVNPAAAHVEDVAESVPGAERRDSTPELAPAVHPLENGDVGVGSEIIPVDARIGRADQHLVVARIRELHSVGDIHVTANGTVSRELSFARHGAPEEGHQRRPAFPGGGAPIPAADASGIVAQHPGSAKEDGGIGARKDVLPAQPVRNDQDDVRRGIRPSRAVAIAAPLVPHGCSEARGAQDDPVSHHAETYGTARARVTRSASDRLSRNAGSGSARSRHPVLTRRTSGM